MFPADRGHHVPAPKGGMSGWLCLVCVFLLCLLVALVGRSWSPVAPGCFPGRRWFLRVCFSVSSEAGLAIRLEGHRPKNRHIFGQVPPCSGEARRLLHSFDLVPTLFYASAVCTTLWRRGAPFAAVAAAARDFSWVHTFPREQFIYGRCRLCLRLHLLCNFQQIRRF